MDPVHDRGSIDPVHESGPWTRSKVGVHGPLVHVLSSPIYSSVALDAISIFYHDASRSLGAKPSEATRRNSHKDYGYDVQFILLTIIHK